MAAQNVSLGIGGLINIPIKIYGIVGEKSTSGKTHNTHAICDDGKSHTQLTSPKYCSLCKRVVTQAEVITGYSYSKTELIPLSKEELAQIPLASTRNIAIAGFCPAEVVAEISLVDTDNPYRLVGPGDDKPNTVKAFSLFNTVMGKKGIVGLSKIAFTGSSEHICLIRSGENVPEYQGQGVMVLQLVPYRSLVRDLANVGCHVPISAKEEELGSSLVEKFRMEDPKAWLNEQKDTHEDALLELVERKRAGENVAIPVPVAEPKEDTSLLDALMASVGSK